MFSKSSIKSKKEKLNEKQNEKRFSKGNAPNLIEVGSSSEDYSVQMIQKRSKYSGKSFNNASNASTTEQIKPNVLNLDRIRNSVIENSKLTEKILSNASKQKQQSNKLLVIETADQEQQPAQSGDRSLFSYQIQGKQGIKYISQSHFKGRINSQIRQILSKQRRKVQKQQQELARIIEGSFISQEQLALRAKQDQKQPQTQVYQRKRFARYFEEELSEDEQKADIIKCFRCFKKGHIAKNCIEQERKIQCNFCLKEHHHSMCDSSPCFRCCQSGHISQDCNSKGIECRKCKKKGHKSQNCGIYLPLDYHNKDQEYIKNRFIKSDLKKLKCLSDCSKGEGHFNCFQYNSGKQLQPYNAGKSKNYTQQKNSSRFYRR